MTKVVNRRSLWYVRKGGRKVRLSKQWKQCLLCIPGYDVFRDAAGCWFDVDVAERAMAFFPECLTHVEGDICGAPFVLELWQQAIIANLFGWMRLDEKGREVRRFREAFILVPRKNGKTPLVAGMLNYVLFCDGEPAAQIYGAASCVEQASKLFRHARGMVENEPELKRRAKIYSELGHRMIELSDRSFYRVVAADAPGQHGGNTHMAVIDEEHALSKRDLVDVFQTSFASVNRSQPLFIHITTSDYDRISICNEKCDYARNVRDGVFRDAAFLPVLYELTNEEMEIDPECYKRPEVMKRVNPNLGVSVSETFLQREIERAERSPAYRNVMLRLHFNVRTGQKSAWLNMDDWAKCGKGADPIVWRRRQLEALRGETCFVGLDLGAVSDLTALSLVFPRDEGVIVLPFFWVPRAGAIKKEAEYQVPYMTWIREGFLEVTEGSTTDYKFVQAAIIDLAQQFQFAPHEETGKPEIAVDRLFQGNQLMGALDDEGFDAYAFGQGFLSMASPTKRFEELVVEGGLHHGNNPILTWMARNASVKTDPAGCMKPAKPERYGPAKIDGIVATIMALGRMEVRGSAQGSVYDTKGVLSIRLR